jgi:hypothetical protein
MTKLYAEPANQKPAPGERIVEEELKTLPEDERELVRQVVHALRTIRYGSILLTVHDGQLVEISKSVRIRKSRSNGKE